MATYAIGDIQGCYEDLQSLLEEIGFSPSRDRLWFVGDLVNRGPGSLEVLRFIQALGPAALTVLGNHDLHLVMLGEGHGRPNRDDTLEGVLAAPDRQELLAWLRTRPLMHVEGEYALVHAGLLPAWSVAQARELAAEVEEALCGPSFPDFLANLYGSLPAAWDDRLQGWDRLRVIVNAMTRMRFCSREGVIEFRTKGPPDKAPEGCLPWFDVPDRKNADRTIICGHWSALGLRLQPGLMALDTGCLWGGALTAIRLEDRRLFQYRCPGKVVPTGWD